MLKRLLKLLKYKLEILRTKKFISLIDQEVSFEQAKRIHACIFKNDRYVELFFNPELVEVSIQLREVANENKLKTINQIKKYLKNKYKT